MTARQALALGALAVGIGVALGAFGAHALQGRVVPELLGTFETGVRYQIYHGLAIMVVAQAGTRWPIAWRPAVGLFTAGIILFSGSLYLLGWTGLRGWGAVAPAGGACLLLGWGVVAWSAIRAQPSSSS